MIRISIVLAVSFILSSFAAAQSSLQTMVDTEHAFAREAAEKGTKSAFLAFLTNDGLLFMPDKVNGKVYWNGRGESSGLLSWAPNFADISSNGMIGYTTGNWEYRAKGKTDDATGFGQFITIWERQPTGEYKFIVDIGIGHSKPDGYSSNWVTTTDKSADTNERKTSAADSANSFYRKLASSGPAKAYKAYSVDDVRAFREEKGPIVGKKALVEMLKGEKAVVTHAKRSSFFGSADIAYVTNTYTRALDGKTIEKGNTMQIWKLIRGRWLIVLDIYKPIS